MSTASATTPAYGIVAAFATPAQLLHAARQTHAAGYRRFDAFSPFPIHGMNEAMGLGRSPLPWLSLIGGLTGFAVGLGGMLWANVEYYRLNVGGKPYAALEPLIPITFEVTVLLSAFCTVFGMLGLNRLPKLYHPLNNHEPFRRATDDAFFLAIEGTDPRYQPEQTRAFLETLGGTGIALVED